MLSELKGLSGGSYWGGLKGLGGCGELRFWGDVGVKGSRTDWLVSFGSAGGSGGNGIKESAIVDWFVKES